MRHSEVTRLGSGRAELRPAKPAIGEQTWGGVWGEGCGVWGVGCGRGAAQRPGQFPPYFPEGDKQVPVQGARSPNLSSSLGGVSFLTDLALGRIHSTDPCLREAPALGGQPYLDPASPRFSVREMQEGSGVEEGEEAHRGGSFSGIKPLFKTRQPQVLVEVFLRLGRPLGG